MSPLRMPSGYRPDIDGLRCIAILAVILFHAGIPFIRGGFVGVDVFFVISGYLIGSHVYRETRSGKFSLRRFYERRAKRILPALFFVLLTCYVLGCFLLSASELKRFAAQALAAVASCSNFYFWLRAGYFAPKAIANPLLMTWSLGVEEQFYIFFPLMMMLFKGLHPRRLLTVLSILATASLFLAILGVSHYPTATFYLLPSRAWEIGVGCILGIYEIEWPESSMLQARTLPTELLALCGLVAVLACCFLYSTETPFPGLAAVPPVVAAIILIRTRESLVNKLILSAKPMVLIGLISYSWYLWHWPLLSLAHICSGGPLSVVAGSLVAFFALLLSVFSYFAVEQPLRQTKKVGPQLLISYGLACVVFAIPALLLFRAHGWPGRYPQAVKIEVEAMAGFPDLCLVDYGNKQLVSTSVCMPQDNSQKPILALMGDSHASALEYELRKQSATHGWLFYDLTKSSCPQLANVTRAIENHPSHAQECASYNDAALHRVLEDPNIRTVLLAGFWSAAFPSQRGNGFVHLGEPATGTSEQNWANLRAGLEETVQLLKSRNKEVIITTDVPRFDADPLSLTIGQAIPFRSWLRGVFTQTTNFSGAESRSATATAEDLQANQIIAGVAGRTGAQVVDLSQGLCDDTSCKFALNGASLYVDEQHLSPLGAHIALLHADLF